MNRYKSQLFLFSCLIYSSGWLWGAGNGPSNNRRLIHLFLFVFQTVTLSYCTIHSFFFSTRFRTEALVIDFRENFVILSLIFQVISWFIAFLSTSNLHVSLNLWLLWQHSSIQVTTIWIAFLSTRFRTEAKVIDFRENFAIPSVIFSCYFTMHNLYLN